MFEGENDEKRLLRNAPRDRLKSEKAIEMAQRAIIQAEKLLEYGFYEQVILYSYTAMFQGARALLFNLDFGTWSLLSLFTFVNVT